MDCIILAFKNITWIYLMRKEQQYDGHTLLAAYIAMILFQTTFVVLVIFSSIYIKQIKKMLLTVAKWVHIPVYSDRNLKFWINRHKWRTKIGRKKREGFAVHKAPTRNNMLCCCSWEVILVSWDHVNNQSNKEKIWLLCSSMVQLGSQCIPTGIGFIKHLSW